MNDTERDLRELLQTKAREVGAAPRVTPDVLRRGRRRQVGTVAVAGITALAVLATAVVSLRDLNRADADAVPGGPNGNPAFTATIQDFTLTVPQGWTLIDQWSIGANMAVGASEGSSSSCVGQPVEAGTGKNAPTDPSVSVCTNEEKQSEPPPTPPTIPLGGLPILTLSNDDPGLGGSVCNAGGALPSTSATLYIGLDYGVMSTAGWENNVPAWPHPLVKVLEGDLSVEQMPCGPGGYSSFQTGGTPYIAWAGFGSEVTDSDRQALLDVFDGMRVSDDEISGPNDETPGYVLTGAGPDWSIEVRPTDVNVDMGYREPGGHASGVGDFGVPDVPIEAGTANGVVFGAVTFDAERVELRPADGSAPVAGSILQLPNSLGAPFDAFVITSGVAGRIVAVGPDGDLGSDPVGGGGEPSLGDRRVQSDLRNAYVAAKTYHTDGNTYEGFTPQVARSIEPSLSYNVDAQAVADEISIRDVGPDHLVLAEATDTGTIFCIAENSAGVTTYGAVDAQTAEECTGGEAAWGLRPPAPSSTPSSPTGSSADLQGFGTPATLTVRRETPDGCLSIEIRIGNTGMGACGSGPVQPNQPFASMEFIGSGGDAAVVYGYVPPDADRVVLVSDDGRGFDAPILYTLLVEPRVQFFAFPVPVTAGMLRIEDVNGAQLSDPIPLNSAP
jgi:hypothetical protein